jgi:hypothetical protein
MGDWPARLLLDLAVAAEDCYDGEGCPPIPSQARPVFGTLPVLDCPLLVVTFLGVEARAPIGTPANRCAVVPRARLAVWVARCYPTMGDDGSAPNPEAEAAASLTLDADLGCLWDGLTERWAAGELFPTFNLGCEMVQFGVAQPSGPSGGTAAWSIPLTVDLATIR